MTQLALALGCAVLALGTAWWVPRLPEPEAEPDGIQPGYETLRGPSFGASAVLAGLLAGWAASTAPPALWPALVGFAGCGATLALVDLRTTFLPLPLTRLCWALAAAGTALTLLLVDDPGATGLRLAGAAALTTALLWLVWYLGGLGFGDVRLAPLVGLAGASTGWQAWYQSLVLGTVLGAAAGLLVTLWRRRHPSPLGKAFAYGPALWTGPWLALALAS